MRKLQNTLYINHHAAGGGAGVQIKVGSTVRQIF